MNLLSAKQQELLDAVNDDVPARFTDSESGMVFVLLPSDDFDWMRNLLGDEPDVPRLADARSGREYALVPERRYDRFRPFFEEDPPSPEEKKARLHAFGIRAGWNDPAMDIYDDMGES
jgi:hypothetical protein